MLELMVSKLVERQEKIRRSSNKPERVRKVSDSELFAMAGKRIGVVKQ